MIDAVKEYYDKEAEKEWNRLNNAYTAVEYRELQQYREATEHLNIIVRKSAQ
jgi:bisphosphoglycerate-independent phosphoglycerate mutase (AlkP superfamily)